MPDNNSTFAFPKTAEEQIESSLTYLTSLLSFNSDENNLAINLKTADISTAIHALESEKVMIKLGGAKYLFELAEADKAGLLLRLPCPDGTPYYRIERECHRCSAYDGSGIGDTYCTLTKDYLNHEFDDTLVPGCPIPFEVKEYTFFAGRFERNCWEKDFGKTVFLDADAAHARADELNALQKGSST